MSRLRPQRKNNLLPMLALGLAAGVLAACSTAATVDMIPTTAGGLPANAPERPAAQPEYPTVGAMPQRREMPPLTDAEVKSTKAELTTLRQQQEERTKSAAAPDKKAVAPAKTAKKPKDGKAAAEAVPAKEQPK